MISNFAFSESNLPPPEAVPDIDEEDENADNEGKVMDKLLTNIFT